MTSQLSTDSNDKSLFIVQEALETVLQALGKEVTAEVSKKTPLRAAKAWIDLTSGYRQDVDQLINDAYFPAKSQDLVLVRDIHYASVCEHHLMPFVGKIHVAYIPNGKIIGLSKIPRIVNMYSRRLQVQERMVSQIAQLLYERLDARGVAVLATGMHLCTMIRGVRNCSASLVTTAFLGRFRTDKDLRREFVDLISLPHELVPTSNK